MANDPGGAIVPTTLMSGLRDIGAGQIGGPC